ncbi:MAG: tRNA-dependent cyclodipeptide synthase [Chitinophagales bacterium]
MKYKIKKIDSAPNISVLDLAVHRKCYLGISVNNPFFRDKHLGLLLKWIANHFDECVIIIGDYLHRINESILHGESGESAIASSINRGNQIYEILDVTLSILPQNKFKLYRWKQFLDENPNALIEKEKLNQLYNSNNNFRQDILQSCADFIDRLIERGERLYLTKEEAINQSKEYLLEEMGVFSVLIAQGYNVQVYPGTQLKILKDLANNKFPEIKSNLTSGVYIDLTVKKIK